jgi:hypothetical protein
LGGGTGRECGRDRLEVRRSRPYARASPGLPELAARVVLPEQMLHYARDEVVACCRGEAFEAEPCVDGVVSRDHRALLESELAARPVGAGRVGSRRGPGHRPATEVGLE